VSSTLAPPKPHLHAIVFRDRVQKGDLCVVSIRVNPLIIKQVGQVLPQPLHFERHVERAAAAIGGRHLRVAAAAAGGEGAAPAARGDCG